MDPGVELAQSIPYVSVGVHEATRPPLKCVGTPITGQRVVEQLVDEGGLVPQVIAILAVGLRPEVNTFAPPIPQIRKTIPDDFPLRERNCIEIVPGLALRLLRARPFDLPDEQTSDMTPDFTRERIRAFLTLSQLTSGHVSASAANTP